VSNKPPNLILLVLDTVGAKHLSLYGYPRPTTPNLEKLARECTVYTRCFAPSCWTVPSHASMFTGLYPSQHGAYEDRYLLRDNLPHLVSILKASGYRTLGISTNGAVSPATGLCQDFDEFYDLGARDLPRILGQDQAPQKTANASELSHLLKNAVTVRDAWRVALRYLKDTRRVGELMKIGLDMGASVAKKFFRPRPLDNTTPYTRKTVRLMEDLFQRQRAADSPFFLFVNVLQAHHHYRPPLRWRRFSRWYHRAHVDPLRFYRRTPSPALTELVARYGNLYDDEIFYLDTVLGRLWEMFRSTPFFDDTLFIITSDHGEHLGEKGHYTHILSLYNELLWVPLIIRFPRGVAAAGVDRRLASLNDLYATVLDAIGSPLPRPDTSFSLLAPPGRNMAIAQCLYPETWRVPLAGKQAVCQAQGTTFSPPVFAVVTESGMKIIENRNGGIEVYDLKQSLIEDQDLAPTLPPEARKNYQALLEALKTETGFHEVTAGLMAQTQGPAACH